MRSTQMRLLSRFLCIASAAGSANLLTYVDGGIGNVLGTPFGEPGTNATYGKQIEQTWPQTLLLI